MFLSKLEKHEADQLKVLLGLSLEYENVADMWKLVFGIQ